MKTTADSLLTNSKAVLESLETINTGLSGLRVAWQGKAADDADTVNREWMRVMTQLFGTEEEPDKGVLSALTGGLGMASGNYSKTENGVTKVFTDFHDGLQPEEDGGSDDDYSTDTPDDQTDTNKTAVTITFPSEGRARALPPLQQSR
ncbi:hypothetical protein NKH18_50550 [Streptomyces sp. M10(2022)]